MEGVASRAKYECLLFDMDDTLYPWSLGLNLACRKNIQDYMLHHLQIEESDVPRMCLELYKEYGTTMAGLKALGFEFDNDEFHAYVHGRLPYEKLKPDPVLKNLLLSMPQRKIIFTNADKAHAAQVLSRLGLEDCFEGVICFETLNPPLALTDDDEKMDTCNHTADTSNCSKAHGFSSEGESESVLVNKAAALEGESESDTNSAGKRKTKSKLRIICKPSVEAMEAAIKIANIDPKKTIFFDDSTRNIAAAKAVDLRTVIVGSSVLVPGADLALGSIHNIKEALPEIWADGEQSDPVVQSTTVEILA